MTERPGYRVAADKRRSRTAPRRQGHRPGAHQVLDGSALRHQGRGKGKLTVAGYAPQWLAGHRLKPTSRACYAAMLKGLLGTAQGTGRCRAGRPGRRPGSAPSSGPGRGQAAVPPGAVSRPGPHYRSNRSLTFTVTEKSQEKTRESYLVRSGLGNNIPGGFTDLSVTSGQGKSTW